MTFPVSEIKEPEVIGSVTDYDYNFCLLLKDVEGVLYYGSTTRGGIEAWPKSAVRISTWTSSPARHRDETGLFP